jgi:hypothetical protein
MSRLILDAGAFIAFEKGDAAFRARLKAARRLGMDVITTAPVVGQVWRDGARQALVALLIRATRIDAPEADAAKRAGELLAATKGDDVVDALIAGLVRDGDTVVTSDPDDIGPLVSAAGTQATIVAT